MILFLILIHGMLVKKKCKRKKSEWEPLNEIKESFALILQKKICFISIFMFFFQKSIHFLTLLKWSFVWCSGVVYIFKAREVSAIFEENHKFISINDEEKIALIQSQHKSTIYSICGSFKTNYGQIIDISCITWEIWALMCSTTNIYVRHDAKSQ